MNAREVFASIAVAVAVAACSPAKSPAPSDAGSAASGATWRAPRTSWGEPNISGVYTNKDENGTPFEQPADLAGKRLDQLGPDALAALNERRRREAVELAPSLGSLAGADTGAGPPHWYEHLGATNSQAWLITEPADGKFPALTDEGQRRAAANRAVLAKRDQPDSYENLSLYDRCVTRGVPGSMMPAIYGNAYDITQSPGYVTLRYEMIHEARVIPIGAGPRLSSAIRGYMGDARGHWEGDTLVVETTNFRAGGTIDGYTETYRGVSENLKITERFTPVNADTLRWEVRTEDPSTWVSPWTITMPLKRDAKQAVFEYACHEGNLGLGGILRAARAVERTGARR
jgi:hypothetical protein